VAVATISEVVLRLRMMFFLPVRSRRQVGLRFVVGPENGTAVPPANSGKVGVEIKLSRAIRNEVSSPGVILRIPGRF